MSWNQPYTGPKAESISSKDIIDQLQSMVTGESNVTIHPRRDDRPIGNYGHLFFRFKDKNGGCSVPCHSVLSITGFDTPATGGALSIVLCPDEVEYDSIEPYEVLTDRLNNLLKFGS